MLPFIDNPVLLVFAVFLARVLDVSLGTLRTIFVFRGHKYIAALFGFVEILIWIVAVSQVIQNLDSWYLAVAYAGGFAVGNIVGVSLEHKLAIGSELVRAVSLDKSVELARRLRTEGYDVIELEGMNNEKPVGVLLVVEKRRRVPSLLKMIDQTDPDAYYTITDVKHTMKQYRNARKEPGLVSNVKRK